jgi:hypothetical protein
MPTMSSLYSITAMHGTQNAMAVHETIYKYNIIQSLQTRYIFLILCMHVEKNIKNVCIYTFYTTKDESM